MAASSGTGTGSSNFSFSTPFMSSSFADLLASDDYLTATTTTTTTAAVSRGFGDRLAERNGSGVPKFKSFSPPSLPLSPPPLSPSSYFAIPHGLSATELLDSPVLLSTSTLLPSPTTGSFPFQGFNWNNESNSSQNQQVVKESENKYSDFSFQTQPNTVPQAQQDWNYQEPTKQDNQKQIIISEMSTDQTNNQNNSGFQSDYNQYNQPSQTIRESRKSEDGYNWRKYGQKQVKGSENPRSYYKCTFPKCPTKKKVEIRASDGQITEIVYKGTHNHPKPQSTRRSSSSSSSALVPYNSQTNETLDQSYASNGTGQNSSVTTPDNSSISIGDDDFVQSSQNNNNINKSGGDDYDNDEDEPNAKRWKTEGENEGISAPGGSRTVREPRVVVQTTSDIDILDDGYRWRKYGQKVVKGNPNPRSYYKCTSQGCPVRKHVERASHDIRAVITTYEGKHNHNVPAARGSGNHSLNRPVPINNGGFRGSVIQTQQSQAPFRLEMLQCPSDSFPLIRNSMGGGAYVNETQENMFTRTKEEPRDDMFLESLLC